MGSEKGRPGLRCAAYCANYGFLAEPGLAVELATAAERCGWDGFFLYDHLILERERARRSVDPWTTLGAVAAVTTDIKIGVLVTPVPRRNPWDLAHQTVALDRLSGGRFVLGVGLGQRFEHAALGDGGTDRDRGVRMDETLALVERFWAGEVIHYRGAWTLNGAGFRPGPLTGRIPIWVAGRFPNPRPIERAAAADGFFPIAARWDLAEPLRPEQLAKIVTELRRLRRGDLRDYEVIASGCSQPDGSTTAGSVDDYRAAGATWWLEVLEPGRGNIDALRARLEVGPPPRQI